MSITELFENKSLLLRSPKSSWETILYARYLTLFVAYPNRIYLEDLHGLKPILKLILPSVIIISSEDRDHVPYEVEYHLSKLRYLFDKSTLMATEVPYLTLFDKHCGKFINLIGNVQGMKIGIALDNSFGKPAADVSDLLRNLPRHKLNNTFFYLMSSCEKNLEAFLLGPHLISMTEHLNNCVDIAALVSCLDCVITFDNLIAHIAGTMGKVVWLLTPDIPSDTDKSLEFCDYYNNVTVFCKRQGESWVHVFMKVSLYRLLLPVENYNNFTDDEKQIEQDIQSMASAIEIKDTDDLVKLLDARTPPFINVMIETTTVCNLSCSYCPNSTVGRPSAFMEEETFLRIIDSIAAFDNTYSGRISPHFYGEPLLDKRLETFVSYARKQLPASKIELFTNGEMLTVPRYLTLKDAGVSMFIVSQHTPEPSPVVMSTLKTIHDDYPQLYTVRYGDQYHATEKMNRGGLIEATGPIMLALRCNAFLELIFDVDGNSVLCCNDYLSSQRFGNISENTIREIWENPANKRARNLLAYSYFPFAICSGCMSFQTS